MSLADFILYFSPFIGFFLPDFTIKEAVKLVILSFFVLYYVNPFFKYFFQQINSYDLCRPNVLCSTTTPLITIGMPSGHTQTIVFVTMFLYLRYKHFTTLVKIFIGLSILMMYLRVHTKKHTISQVIIGAILTIFPTKFIYKLIIYG
jgi:membrane-associated phospholipid phosphatase